MKTSNNEKAGVFKVTALVAAALLFVGMAISCSNGSDSGGTSVTKYKVTLEKDIGGNVTVNPTLPADGMVAENTELTFTAEPVAGYKFVKWQRDGTDAGTETTYKHTVTQAVQVKAVFAEDNPALITKYAVTLTLPVNGTVKSVPEIPSDNQVPKDTEITFTATPASGYAVDKWTISTGTFTAGGTAGSATATIKVTVNVTVGVIFKEGGNTSIDGVWKMISIQKGSTIQTCPVTEDGITTQPYLCFTAGKFYFASEISGSSQDGLYKDSAEGTPFTLDGAKIMIDGEEFAAFGLSGNTMTLNIADGDFDTMVLEKTANPTVGQVLAASVFVQVKDFEQLLEYYLGGKFSTEKVNYIEITGVIPAADFIPHGPKPSNLSTSLKDYSDIKIALKIKNYPAGLTEMYGCFEDCTNLVSLASLPDGLDNINGLFKGCTNLTGVPTIPAGVTNMNSCFYECTSLTRVPDIPDSVTNMNGCFKGCTNLATVPDIPASVKRMATCFENCTSLTGVKLKCNYNPVKPPLSLDLAFKDAFKACTALTAGSIKVPSGQLTAYRNAAGVMGTEAENFEEE